MYIKKGYLISKKVILDEDVVCEINCLAKDVSDTKKIYWEVYSVRNEFEKFTIITDTKNTFRVDLPKKSTNTYGPLPKFVLAHAVHILLDELNLVNSEYTPTIHLVSYNKFLVSEFKAAGFRVDRKRSYLTLVYDDTE